MKLVFLGSPEAAVVPLQALHAAGHEIVLVVTGADKRRGRGRSLTPTPVKAAALELGLAVTDNLDDVMDTAADLGVVVAYGRIIRPEMLAHLRMINIHFSLLPRWRGAAPVERAILAGDRTTGVCVMDVEEGLDTGGVHASAEVEIGDAETALQLRQRLTAIGAELLVTTLAKGLGEATPQADDGVVYAEKIHPADRMLDPMMTVETLLRIVRIGGAWTQFRAKRLKVIEARPAELPSPDGSPLATEAAHGAPAASSLSSTPLPGTFLSDTVLAAGDGAIELVLVQPEGKAAMAARDWARGARPSGDRIGT